MEQAYQATKEELREGKRRCWSPDCKHTAWLKDGGGWNWCFYHAYRGVRWGGGHFWIKLKSLRLRWPY